MTKTIEFSATFGFVPGYNHDNATAEDFKDTINDFVIAWQKYADEACEAYGVYVSCVLHPTKTIYKTEWGCPSDGENTLTVEGAYNPSLQNFEYYALLKYRNAVEFIVYKMKAHLKQTTVRIIFRDVEQVYYKGEE